VRPAEPAALDETGGRPLAAARITPVKPRFEDGFMVLLKQTADPSQSAAMTLAGEPPVCGDEVIVEV
jgi:hypothetical protein